MAIYGTDLAINFETSDLDFTNNNDFELISEEENLVQAVKTRLLTMIGSLATHVNFGSNVYQIIGMTQDDDTLNAAGSYVYQALEAETRIDEIVSITTGFVTVEEVDYLVINASFKPIESDETLNLVVEVAV